MNILKRLYNWIDERVKLEDLVHFLGKKYVPVHRNSVWYYFGGVSLFFFIIQVVTGILLLFYYKGTADIAFESIQFIMSKVQFGWLIRSLHTWSANLFILACFIHMFSVYFERSYRKPREVTWITGMLMFFLALGFGFSGYLLPWNELAFFATKVGTDIAGAVPLIGEPLKIFYERRRGCNRCNFITTLWFSCSFTAGNFYCSARNTSFIGSTAGYE